MKTRVLIMLLAVAMVAVPGSILTVLAGDGVDEATDEGIESRLMDLAQNWRITCDSYENNILVQEEKARLLGREIIIAQTKMAYELIEKTLVDGDGILSNEEKEDLLTRLARPTVGRTGYIYILDYQGSYILSKDRQRDGENIWESTYDGEIKPAQELIRIGEKLTGAEVGFFEYNWVNAGDIEPRQKISAIVHFPEPEWIVGVTAYYDDVVDTDYRIKTIEEVKDLIAEQEVGRSGYIAVLDSAGHYVVSKDRARDGEDISQSQDADGRFFVQDTIANAIAAGTDADSIKYSWQNPGESQARQKVGGLAYYEAWDWIIWPSAYTDDFSKGSSTERSMIFTIIIASVVAGFIGYELTRRIQKNRDA